MYLNKLKPVLFFGCLLPIVMSNIAQAECKNYLVCLGTGDYKAAPNATKTEATNGMAAALVAKCKAKLVESSICKKPEIIQMADPSPHIKEVTFRIQKWKKVWVLAGGNEAIWKAANPSCEVTKPRETRQESGLLGGILGQTEVAYMCPDGFINGTRYEGPEVAFCTTQCHLTPVDPGTTSGGSDTPTSGPASRPAKLGSATPTLDGDRTEQLNEVFNY